MLSPNSKICVDFDGTCVSFAYPEVGRSIGAERVLRRLVNEGHLLILFTMRSGKHLQDAVDWFGRHDIPLYGIQKDPDQEKWTDSPKAYGHHYIDDAALGVPLVKVKGSRPYVDWDAVEKLLFPS